MGNKYKKIIAGYGCTMGITEEKTVRVCGYNMEGQLVTQQKTDKLQNTGLIKQMVKDIKLGYNFALFIDEKGEVTLYGNNEWAQLCHNENKRQTGLNVGLTHVSEIFTGPAAESAYARMEDGVVVCWGKNVNWNLGFGELTPDHTISPYRPQTFLRGAKKIGVGQNHGIALLNDGNVLGWGLNYAGQVGVLQNSVKNPTKIAFVDDAKDLLCGMNFNAILTNDGSLAMWGDNSMGQTLTYHPIPDVVDNLPPIEKIGVGWHHVIALTKDKRLIGWGLNYHGQIAPSEANVIREPIEILSDASRVKDISCGAFHTYILKDDGTAVGWGSNHYKELDL